MKDFELAAIAFEHSDVESWKHHLKDFELNLLKTVFENIGSESFEFHLCFPGAMNNFEFAIVASEQIDSGFGFASCKIYLCFLEMKDSEFAKVAFQQVRSEHL
jgi:hypothetical protein